MEELPIKLLFPQLFDKLCFFNSPFHGRGFCIVLFLNFNLLCRCRIEIWSKMIRFSFVRDSHGTCDGETLAVEIEDINICLLMCDPPLKPPAFHPRNQIYSPPELYQILECLGREIDFDCSIWFTLILSRRQFSI